MQTNNAPEGNTGPLSGTRVLAMNAVEVVYHVNLGESEDYVRGFNKGYDAAFNGQAFPTPLVGAPDRMPWRWAFARGYQSGWECFDEAVDELAAELEAALSVQDYFTGIEE